MIAAFSITPLGTGESVGDVVADAVRIVHGSGLDVRDAGPGELELKIESVRQRLR